MNTTWTVPKNIRQIGEAHAHYAIYIEDYVSTYIRQVVRLSDGGIRQGALVGKVYPEGEKTIFVIQGIVTDKELYRTREQLFSFEGKEELRSQCGQFFAELDMIGEVVFDSRKEESDTVRRGMLSEEAGALKMLLQVDYSDGTQKFYIGSQGAVECVESYYIYYDRNEAMQNYLISYNEETRRKVEEVHDVISGQARAAMGEIRLPRARMQKDTLLISVACALLICVSLLGIININQYQKMCEMQESFHEVLASLGFGDDRAVPASSDAAGWDRTDGDIVMDITPEDGMAAGNGQDELFDGLPIYVSDVSGTDGESASGQNGGADGETEDNSGANASGQTGDGDSAAGVPGQIGAGNDGAGTSGQDGAGNGEANASGQNVSGDGAAGVSGQDGAGNDGADASGQTGTGSNETDASGQGVDGDADDTLTASGAGENTGGTYREYTIKRGDTLTAISMHFYQSKSMIGEICRLNGIENADNIVAGQKILLP